MYLWGSVGTNRYKAGKRLYFRDIWLLLFVDDLFWISFGVRIVFMCLNGKIGELVNAKGI